MVNLVRLKKRVRLLGLKSAFQNTPRRRAYPMINKLNYELAHMQNMIDVLSAKCQQSLIGKYIKEQYI